MRCAFYGVAVNIIKLVYYSISAHFAGRKYLYGIPHRHFVSLQAKRHTLFAVVITYGAKVCSVLKILVVVYYVCVFLR